MRNIRITKKFTFEASHALFGYDGKCKNIHGHSYALFVTLLGTPIQEQANSKLGMVIDFGDLKEIVNRVIVDVYDHATILNENSPHKQLGDHLLAQDHKVIFLDFQPTCENLLLHFVEEISNELPKGVTLVALKLYETETSYCQWNLSDQLK